MVEGLAGFSFPKSHCAAYGLLAYQSTWLRVHYPSEFLCALLNEQPMGFYPTDLLIHEGQRWGITILPPDVNQSDAECSVAGERTIRIGLGYIRGINRDNISRLVSSRNKSGVFKSLGDFATRARVSPVTLERLAWSGACDKLAGGGPRARRNALWQLGVATVSRGQQLTLALPLDSAPRLPALSAWDAMVADYSTTGISIDRHPLKLSRASLASRGATSIAELSRTPHSRRVTVGGLVIARQRPQTAHGTTFLLLEDECGTLNVIVPTALYEREQLTIHTEPLVLVEGRLQRHTNDSGTINLLATAITRLASTIYSPTQAAVTSSRPGHTPIHNA
jgi:error-prone DNA polymerase